MPLCKLVELCRPCLPLKFWAVWIAVTSFLFLEIFLLWVFDQNRIKIFTLVFLAFVWFFAFVVAGSPFVNLLPLSFPFTAFLLLLLGFWEEDKHFSPEYPEILRLYYVHWVLNWGILPDPTKGWNPGDLYHSTFGFCADIYYNFYVFLLIYGLILEFQVIAILKCLLPCHAIV